MRAIRFNRKESGVAAVERQRTINASVRRFDEAATGPGLTGQERMDDRKRAVETESIDAFSVVP